jgi:hypothetical protein
MGGIFMSTNAQVDGTTVVRSPEQIVDEVARDPNLNLGPVVDGEPEGLGTSVLKSTLLSIEEQANQLKKSLRNIECGFNSLEAVFVLVAVLNLAATISFPFVDSSFLNIFENNPANMGFYFGLMILSIAAVIILQVAKKHLMKGQMQEIIDINNEYRVQYFKKQATGAPPRIIQIPTEDSASHEPKFD